MHRILLIVGVLAIFVLALLIIACGSDDTPTPSVATTAPPTPVGPTAAQTATPPRLVTPGPTAEPTPAPTAPPTETAAPAPAPTPGEPEAADPSDAYFAMDRVLEVRIEIAEEDWDTLRHQTRTFGDLMAEIEKYNLSQPFRDIYTWFSATVTIDGETHTEVGVRKKGFLGSQSDAKPSLKLRFDKYVDDQALGGVIERMTLNNSIQDASMINTCLSYQIFAAAGLPSSRCSFATVSVNGKDLGLYVHVEEIKKPFLARHFDSAEGNLYEGTISDFTSTHRGTFEKKTNEDENDWSDIDAVVAALQDPSDAGLQALGDVVDLDRFLSFWATEVLVGHWDGYTGGRNNYHFYREPDGPFVFIPWGVDGTFHLEDDPNPFDNISNPPPSVLALSAIPNRLYNNADWRVKYAARLKEILQAVWDEEELLASVDQMAAIVHKYALPEVRDAAGDDAQRVRKFILKRKGEILADLTPEPPEWPEPEPEGEPIAITNKFETTWGSNKSANPFEEGSIIFLLIDEVEEPLNIAAALAGPASPDEQALMPGVDNLASLSTFYLGEDGALAGMTLVMPMSLLTDGATLVIGQDRVAGGVWTIPPGGTEPDSFELFTGGTLELSKAGTGLDAPIVGAFTGVFGGSLITGPDYLDSPRNEYLTTVVDFETTWGSNKSADPFQEGTVTRLLHDDEVKSVEGYTAMAGLAGADEQLLLPDVEDLASIAAFSLDADGALAGMTFVLPMSRLTDGATLVIGKDNIAGGIWGIPPGGSEPDLFLPFGAGTLELSKAGTEPGAAIVGSFSGSIDLGISFVTADYGLIINEVAAKGDPLDWFELYNATDAVIDLSGFVVADDLTDAPKRVAFPPGMVIAPGEYLQVEVDNNNWAGFKLGGDEELGIWTADGDLVGMVDWDEGHSGDGESLARVPDISGGFQTVSSPTPGTPNQP